MNRRTVRTREKQKSLPPVLQSSCEFILRCFFMVGVIAVVGIFVIVAGVVVPAGFLMVEGRHHHTQHVGFHLLQVLDGEVEFGLLGLVEAHGEDHSIRQFDQWRGIGDDAERCGIDQHVVVMLFQSPDQIMQLVGADDFGRIRRTFPARQHAHVRDHGVLHSLLPRHAIEKHFNHAGLLGRPEHTMHPRTAEVTVDHADLLPALRKGYGQVGAEGGLSFRFVRGGDNQRFERVVGLGVDHVGLQASETLRNRGNGIKHHHETCIDRMTFHTDRLPSVEVVLDVIGHVRNHRQQRIPFLAEFLDAVDFDDGEFPDEHISDTAHKTK